MEGVSPELVAQVNAASSLHPQDEPQGGTAVPGELPETADVEAFAVDEANPDGADVVAQVQKDTLRPQQ